MASSADPTSAEAMLSLDIPLPDAATPAVSASEDASSGDDSDGVAAAPSTASTPSAEG
jgi:hypothetical protein